MKNRLFNRWAGALLALVLALPAGAQKISADPTASTLAGGEFIAGVQSSANVKILPSQLLAYTLANLHSVNAQTGTSYTYLASDRGKLVTHSNASSISAGLSQATGSFSSGWFMLVQNRGAGTLTITPTTSTIDGGSTLVLAAGQGAFVISDGINWYTLRAAGGSSSAAGTNTQIQYNNAGSFGAEAGFEYDAASNTLTAPNVSTTGLVVTAASATGSAGFRLPHGAAPTSPVNGDLWTTSAGGLYARINGTTVGPFAAAGGGSLTNFTEAVNTATPNTTVPAVSLTVTNAASDVDLVLQKKGATGAIMLQVPDNAATGGNKRGSGAIDLGLGRSSASKVASGSSSCIFGGTDNVASATKACAVGGDTLSASGTQSLAAGGSSHTASGSYSGAVAGISNNAGGQASGMFAGSTNSASSGATNSVVLGGEYADVGVLQSVQGFSGGRFSTAGDSMVIRFVHNGTTTSTTPLSLGTDRAQSGAPNANRGMVLINSRAAGFDVLVTVRDISTGDMASFLVRGSIKRGANAAATSIVGTVTTTALGADASLSGATVTAIANTTLGSLEIQVTGIATNTLHWTAEGRVVISG